MDRERVVVAEVLRTRGIAGEVVVRSLTDIPGRLESLQHLRARLADGTESLLKVASAWPHRENWVLKFEGLDSIEAAEPLRGADLWVPLSERGALAEGEFFQADLIGCQLVDTASGASVGTVEGWQEFGGPLLMEVRTDRGQALIPFVSPLCDVNLAERTIRMDLPAGILEL